MDVVHALCADTVNYLIFLLKIPIFCNIKVLDDAFQKRKGQQNGKEKKKMWK